MEDELKWELSEGRRFKRRVSGFSSIPFKQLEEASDHIHVEEEALDWR